ncbi:MAG TPA: 2Fe-2S iron-sulfur cluster binding domain-containing protein [Gammaproteobacteria bacterium]|nr:2Fe-2S iron-sulfur cluster binding domain-containing protein [Gammaproteobacteria bacterium]
MTQCHFLIDGKDIPFHSGQTIMDAAMAAGVYIPHLCHNPDYEPTGSCRLCLVKLNGRYVSACTQPAQAGSQVENQNEEINQQRKTLLQMLFVEGNHQCPGCEKSGRCQLQAVAYYVGMLSPYFTHFYPNRQLDASHPETVLDFNRCILCGLCVRASHYGDKKDLFAISGRGIKSHLVINSPSGKLGDSQFNAHDLAASVCPVGVFLPKHKGYEVPIGQRLYDRQPISRVGDVARQNKPAGRS